MKKTVCILIPLLLLSFSTAVFGNEWANYYFPDAPGSYWVYEDQDGNELTRYAIEPEEIDGNTYRAFSYDPPLAEWSEFEHHFQPYYYQVGEDWVAFYVGSEVENALKETTTRQMEEALAMMRQMMLSQMPPELNVSFELDYEIDVESRDYFYFLPTPATFDEEWTAGETDIGMTLVIDIKGLPMELPGGSEQNVETRTSLTETGNVTGTETVDTDAGSFEECLVIEYRVDAITETDTPEGVPDQGGPQSQEDINVTTVWLAPGVGIVKFEHLHEVADEAADIGMTPPVDKTFELIRYEIASKSSEE